MIEIEMEVDTLNILNLNIFDAIKSGDLNSFKSIVLNDVNKLQEKTDKNNVPFYVSCLNGHMDIAQWIYSICPEQIHLLSHDNKCTPFYASCHNGHIDIAQWIYSVCPEQISLRGMSQWTFTVSTMDT